MSERAKPSSLARIDVDDIVRTIDLSIWEIAALRALLGEAIQDSYTLTDDSRVCTRDPAEMARFEKLAEKLQ